MEKRDDSRISSAGVNQSPAEIKKKLPREPLRRLVSFGVATALAAGLAGCAGENEVKATPEATQTQVEEVIPTEEATSTPEGPLYTETLPSGEDLRELFYMPAGLPDQELAALFFARVDAAKHFGASEALVDQLDADFYTDPSETIESMVRRAQPDIQSAMYTDDLLERAPDFSEGLKNSNIIFLTVYLNSLSERSGREIGEPYTSWTVLDSVEEWMMVTYKGDRETARGLIIDVTYYDNADKTNIDSLSREAVDGSPARFYVVFQEEDGIAKIDYIGRELMD